MTDLKTTMSEKKGSLSEEQFEALLGSNKKFVVKELAEKIANSPELKKIWINSQVEGEKPLIQWDDEKLKAIARDYYEWE